MEAFIDCENEIDIIKKYLTSKLPSNFYGYVIPGSHVYIINIDKQNHNFYMKISLINDINHEMYGFIYSSNYILYGDGNEILQDTILRTSKTFHDDWEEYNLKVFEILSEHFNEYIGC